MEQLLKEMICKKHTQLLNHRFKNTIMKFINNTFLIFWKYFIFIHKKSILNFNFIFPQKRLESLKPLNPKVYCCIIFFPVLKIWIKNSQLKKINTKIFLLLRGPSNLIFSNEWIFQPLWLKIFWHLSIS